MGASSLVFQTVAGSRILTPSVMGFDALYMLIQTVIVYAFGSVLLGLGIASTLAWLVERSDLPLRKTILEGETHGCFDPDDDRLAARADLISIRSRAMGHHREAVTRVERRLHPFRLALRVRRDLQRAVSVAVRL